MKKIIDGKRYDTETATKVANWDNGCYGNDFNAVDEDLYITKNGNWFLDGSGGARSKYATCYGSSSCGGRELIPMSADEAKKWLEEHNCVNALEQYFSSDIVDA